MHYDTYYTLSHDGTATTAAITAAFIAGSNYFCFDERDNFDAGPLLDGVLPATTWYDHDAEMLAVSTLLPGVTLTLDGEGEEQGDVWRKVYRDGKIVKQQKARLVFDDGEEV